MRLDLPADPDGRVTTAARAAIVRAGLALAPEGGLQASAWWRAGLEDATEGPPVPTRRYDAARSPRSTRGATRA